MVEAEALGHRPRELVLGERLGRDEDALGRGAGRRRLAHRAVHRVARDEAEVDDDVAQHPA